MKIEIKIKKSLCTFCLRGTYGVNVTFFNSILGATSLSETPQ
jgi:hypothetical protein